MNDTLISLEPTPPPWRFKQGNGDTGWFIRGEEGSRTEIHVLVSPASDAKRIVRCVNTHDELVAAVQLAIDFHGADTTAFVEKYGHGVGTREMCDRLRAALALAKKEVNQ